MHTHNLNLYNPPASLRSHPHSARHPPLHREGYNKATPSVTFGDSSLKEGAKGSFATPSVSLRSTTPLIYPKKTPRLFLGPPGEEPRDRAATTKKRKTPAGFPAGAFLAIGLSINQTVVSETSHSSIGELVESIVFRLVSRGCYFVTTVPLTLTVPSTQFEQ